MRPGGRRLRDSIEEIVAHIGLFAGAGPIIGSVVFSLIMLFWAFAPESIAPKPHPSLLPDSGIAYVLSRLAYFLLALFFTTIFSYVLAGLAAAFTGLVVALAWFWMLRSKWLFLLAAIVGGVSSVLNLFAALVINIMYDFGMKNFDQHIKDIVENFREVSILVFITGAASAVICTYLTKSFRQNEQPPSGEAELHPDMSA